MHCFFCDTTKKNFLIYMLYICYMMFHVNKKAAVYIKLLGLFVARFFILINLSRFLCPSLRRPCKKKGNLKDAGAEQWISPSLSCKGSWETQFSNPLSSLTRPTSDRRTSMMPSVTQGTRVDPPRTNHHWSLGSPTLLKTCPLLPTATRQGLALTSTRPSSPCTRSTPTARPTATAPSATTATTAYCSVREPC